MSRRRRPYRRQYADDLNVSKGQQITYPRNIAGNRHTYILEGLVKTILTEAFEVGLFKVLNPTTFFMTSTEAISANLELFPGDKVIISDTGEEVKNDSNSILNYSSYVSQRIVSGRYVSLYFTSGANNVQVINLNNGFQSKKVEITTDTPVVSDEFFAEVINAPSSFEGYVRVQNATVFEDIRTDYPSVSVPNPKVTMSYPSGLGVIATYDTGNSFQNDGLLDDFFYLRFERSGGDLVVTKFPINTTPNGI